MRTTTRFLAFPFFLFRFYVFFLVFVPATFGTLNVFAQSYFFRNYNVENGLPFTQVRAIYQDSKGNLWTGAHGGLSRFNGAFANFGPKDGLVHHSVTCITEDKKGCLWIGTLKGVSKLEKGKFTSYTAKDGLSDDNIRACLTDLEGNVWFATAKGLTKYDGKSFEIIDSKKGLPSVNVTTIYQDSSHTLWLGTADGLVRLSNAKFTFYTMKNGLADNAIQSICADRWGRLWIGTNNGLSVYAGGKFATFRAHPGLNDEGSLPDNDVNAIQMDSRGSVWVGTNNGLCKILEGSSGQLSFETYSVSQAPNSNIVECMTLDYEGNMWFGTHNGLYRYRSDMFALFGEKDGLKNTFIYPILRDATNNLFVGTQGGGFYLYNGKTFTHFGAKEGLVNSNVHAAVLDKDKVFWIGTDGGLSRFDGHTFKNYTRKDGLSCDSVTEVYIDDTGLIWLGGHTGISTFDGKSFKTYDLPRPCESAAVYAIRKDKNNTVWIGTYIGGLYKYEHGEVTSCTSQLGIKSSSVISIAENKAGDLFFGTLDGVFMYSGNQTVQFSEEDGMSSDLVYVLLLDHNASLWVGTNQGLNKIDIDAYKKTGHKVIKPYTQEEGFQGVECNGNGAYEDPDGCIWFGTVNGLIKYAPKEDFSNPLEPRTAITSVSFADRDTLLPDSSHLGYDRNTLTFNFASVCLSDPAKVLYKYKLEGVDRDWSLATKGNFVKYSGLQPGNYVFKVRGSNTENIWNAKPVSLSFTIVPPYWKTWWFRLLSIGFGLALVFLYISIRLQQIRRKEKEKTEIQKRIANIELLALRYQMNPHFIFNTMASIQHFISNNEPDEAMKYLSRFAKLMRAIMDNSKQNSISVKDEIDTLKLYLELEDMRFSNKFEYSLYVDPLIDSNYEEIPSMLIQPYVENAILHGLLPRGENGKLSIRLTKNDNFIVCSIEDNGVGRVRSAELGKNRVNQHRSRGMSITKERLSILNHMSGNTSTLTEEVTDLYDEKGNPAGTKVVIRVPLEIT